MQNSFRRGSVTILLGICLLLILVPPSRSSAQVLHYTFDEASSGTTPALDSGSGTPANGIFMGAATRTANSMGNTLGALDLTANGGSGNWISDADPDNPNKPDKLDSMPGVTVSMWINVRGTISNTTTLASDVANVPVPAGQGGWSFGIGGPDPSNSNVFMEVWNSNSGAGQGSSFRINADRQWVMVAGSFDNATHQLKTYFGTPTSSVVASNVTGAAPDRILLPNDQPFMVAKMPFASPTVPAWIDDVRVYDHALTLSELEAARVAGVPEPCAGVLCAGMMLMTTRRVSR